MKEGFKAKQTKIIVVLMPIIALAFLLAAIVGPAMAAPTIDGVISTGEWVGAVSRSITLQPNDDVSNIEVQGTLYFTRDATNLYIGLIVESNTAGITWFKFNDEPNTDFNNFDDALYLSPEQPNLYDFHWDNYDGDSCLNEYCAGADNGAYLDSVDSNLKQPQDGTRAISVVGSQTHYEASHPLCSGTSFDFCLDTQTIWYRIETFVNGVDVVGFPKFGMNLLPLSAVAYYPFNGNARDESLNGNDGEAFGGPTLTADEASNAESAYNFPGAGNITIPRSQTLSGSSFQNGYTIAAWINPSTFPWETYDVDAMNIVSTDPGGIVLRIIDDNNEHTYVDACHIITNASICARNDTTALSTGQWYHSAVTWDPSTTIREVYINATPKTLTSLNDVLNMTLPEGGLKIGGPYSSGSGDYYFQGTIDEVYVFNRALSQAEIQRIMEIGSFFTPPCAGFGGDTDGDGVCNDNDNCPHVKNDQTDGDEDGVGNACDTCPNDHNPGEGQTLNSDGDRYPDACDNCPYVANNDQKDDDDNGIGNACEDYQMSSNLAGSTITLGASQWDTICFKNDSTEAITLIKPDCANITTRWINGGVPAVTRDRHIKIYGIPNDLLTIPGPGEYCINCDIAQTIAPENLSTGATYDVDHWYSDWLKDRWIDTNECGAVDEPCFGDKWRGWMRTEVQTVTVASTQAANMLDATCSFDPNVWIVDWANIPGGLSITATVIGPDFEGLVPSSILLNGRVAPISHQVLNDELILAFNRKDATASFQTPPLHGRFSQTIQGQVDDGYFTARADVLFIEAINVTIDIKPGANPNSINLGSNGNVPTAILSSADFDATTVDPETVTLADAKVRVVGKKSKLQASLKDVNGDGLTDLFLHIDTTGLQLTNGDVMAYLEGRTYDGEPIVGKDTIRIVP